VRPWADDTDLQTWQRALHEGLVLHGLQLHAWALTPTEARLLLTPADARGPARLVQHLGRRYVAAYRRRHGGHGTVWDGRFRCAVLEPGATVLEAMRWVEAAADGPSSAAHHLGQAADRRLTDPPAYWLLGNTPFEREGAWQQLLQAGLPAARAQRFEQALRGGWAVGSEAFVAQAAGLAHRPVAPRPRGRPRRPRAADGTSPGSAPDPLN
jgi:putative transposase